MGEREYGKGKKRYGIMTMKIRGQFPTNVTAIVFQKHYCEFHYSDYAQTNPDEVVKSFYILVDDAVQNTNRYSVLVLSSYGSQS